MSPERRIHARRILYSPEYLDMGADNGGMVVNLSETGLGFQAVSPVLPQTEIPISFSLGTGYRIDVKARVAWVNGEGKVGGVTFGKLSKDSRSLIHEWLVKTEAYHESDHSNGESGESAASNAATASPAVTAEQETSRAELSRPESRPPATEAAQNGAVLPGNGVRDAASAARAPRDIETSVEPVSHASSPQVPGPRSAPSMQDSASPSPVRRVLENLPTAAAPCEGTSAPVLQKASLSPPRASEQNREPQSDGSFSLVPSISAWSRGDAPASSVVRGHRAPLFPPKNAENIFARSPSHPENAHEGGRSRKLFVLGIVIAAAAVGAFYARTHRQQVGAVIVDMGDRVAGKPVPGPSVSASSQPARSGNAGGYRAASIPSPNQRSSPVQGPSAKPQGATVSQSAIVLTVAGPGANSAASSAGSSVPTRNDARSTAAQPNAPGTAFAHPVNGPAQLSDSKPKGMNPKATSPSVPLAGRTEYQRAEQYLNGKGVAQDYGEAAQWFWRSLEAGYTGAALPLANLYLEGNGVSRSCTQARILLDAAAQKNNAQAIQQLAQLPENCQ